MSESRKIPPSKIKYLQKNPVVSFHLPLEMRDISLAFAEVERWHAITFALKE
jgi:hypothetical protein